MNIYIIIAIGIAAITMIALITTFVIAIIKGVRAGNTDIEVKIAGIFSVTVHLTDVSKK